MATTIPNISEVIQPYSVTPVLNSATFPEDIDTYNQEQPSRIDSKNTVNIQMNATVTAMNIVSEEVEDNAVIAQQAAADATSSSNNKGAWSNLSGALSIPASVNHNGNIWALNVDLVDVTLSEPSEANSDWTSIGTLSNIVEDLTPQLGGDLDLNGNKIVDLNLQGSITEQVGVMTTVIGSTLGTVQTKSMTTDTTFTDGLATGQSMVLHLSTGGFTPTYPTITWIGGAEPTYTTTDGIVFYKIGTTLYGAYIGSVVA